MNFMENWLPNIICGIVSTGVTYEMAKRVISAEAKRSANVNDSILRLIAEMNRLELVYDEHGRPTGGKHVRLAAIANAKSAVMANLTTGPSTVAGIGTVA